MEYGSSTKRERNEQQPRLLPLSVRAQDLGFYPKPSPLNCTNTLVLCSVDGGHSYGGAAGGGHAPADPAAQEELFVDGSGTAAVWRTLGGQITHASFRSAVLGPGAHGLAAGGGHAAIAQVVRCRFPTLLEGWSSKQDGPTGRETGGNRGRRKQQEKKEHHHHQRRRRRGRRGRARRGPWSVCVLRKPDLVTVHYPNGDSYDVTLPCEARLLQPLQEGLLVQRFSSEADDEYLGGDEGAAARRRRDDPMEDDFLEFTDTDTETPSLFSLLHPLDELRPVAHLPPSAAAIGVGPDDSGHGNGENNAPVPSAPDDQRYRLVCDAGERVIFAGGGGANGTGPDSSLLLTYHAGRRRHSLWHVLPVPEPPEQQRTELEREQESKLMSRMPPAPAAGDVSVLGPLMHETPRHDGWRVATTMSTPAADGSSVSSTLLGVSALDSSSSVAALSMIDPALPSGAGGGRRPRDRVSIGNARRVSGGGGRRASSGSNVSWIGASATRNEALASALGLGQSALGVATPMLGRRTTGGGGSAREVGTEEYFPPQLPEEGIFSGKVAVLDAGDTILEDGEEEDNEAQNIRPNLGLSLLWREAEGCRAPAQHVFCAAASTPARQEKGSAAAGPVGVSFERNFFLCLVEGQSKRLRVLSVSVNDAVAATVTGTSGEIQDCGVTIAEAFTTPCRAAVGLCATTGAEGEGTPGGAIAADILVLTPDHQLILQCGECPVTTIKMPPPHGPDAKTVVNEDEDEVEDQIESLCDAIGSCFTVETRNGQRRRARLSLKPASPLVAACLGSWDCLLTPALAASLRADVVSIAQALAIDGASANGRHNQRWQNGIGKSRTNSDWHAKSDDRVGGDLDWAALVSVMRELVLGDDSSADDDPPVLRTEERIEEGHTTGNNSGGDGSNHGSTAWAALLSSPFHDQFSRDSFMLLSGLRVRGWNSERIDSATPASSIQPITPSLDRPRRRALHTRSAAFRDEVSAVFDSLHLVLEDMKISRLTTSLVPRLASLLLSLARACGGRGKGMRDFEDHYWRDVAGCGNGCGEGASMIHLAGEDLSGGWLPVRPTHFQKVPCIRGWVHARIQTGILSATVDPTHGQSRQPFLETPRYSGDAGPFPTLSRSCGALQSTRRLCRFYGILCNGSGEGPQGTDSVTGIASANESRGFRHVGGWVGANLVAAMVDEGYGVENLEHAQLGLTLPLLEVLHAARGQAPADWPAAAQELVGREDLSALRQMLNVGRSGGSDGSDDDADDQNARVEESFGQEGGYWAGGRISGSGAGNRSAASVGGHAGVVAKAGSSSGGGRGGSGNGEASDLDGLAWVDEVSSLRFGRDRRVREACRLLRGSRPVRFHVERSPESSDHDHQQRQQARLLQLAMRTLAGPAGRGMLTLGTLAPLLAEPLPIPPLCLAGRIRKPADVVVNLDISAAGVTGDTTLWAEFHNGVAAGLRLRHEWGSGDGRGSRKASGFEDGRISRTWITYNRPAGGANNAHGGLLMALGLQGHLSSLAMTDIYEYLTLGQESTTVGVLLGMAAARRGSADLSTHKMLCLHVPSLLPHPFAEMETSSVTQAAALAGVGLLYQGTSHRLMTEFLLSEMGKSPCSDRFADREGYALACGLSLGMINLGKGASGGMAGVADLKLEEQLHRLLVGGKDPSSSGGGDPSAPNSRAGGGSREGRRPSSGGVIGSEVTGPSRISSGEYVNTDVTAPAALAALALMHMRSGDRALAARLALPQSHFQLDYARPEQLLLRVVVRGLVLWDEVLPTEDWVDEQIPEVVSTEYARLHEPLPEEMASVVDRQTIRQAHANVVAGACLCLGLRFAGTADERARATVLGRVVHFKRLRESSTSGGGSRDLHLPSRRPERPVLEMCLSTSVTALGMIMAGTGDLECLRVMRELRGRVEGEVTYGTHMAISMGIGLLFLGGGMASLGREKEHIAALLAAFFPRYPATPDDNQYHLQALRHLYVLAVQRRGVDAVDVDTGESLFVPLTVYLHPPKGTGDDDQSGQRQSNNDENIVDQDGNGLPDNDLSLAQATPLQQSTRANTDPNLRGATAREGPAVGARALGAERAVALVTPCILPDLSEVSRVSIKSPRYFPVELDLTGDPAVAAALRRQCKIYVKRRVGHLSYKNDPHALRSLLFQSYPGPMASSSAMAGVDSQYHHHSRGPGHHAHDLANLGDAGGGSDDLGQSKADFLSTFTEDPHLLNFARHFCDAGSCAAAGAGGGGGGTLGLPSGRRLMIGTRALGEAPAVARYFGGALLECLAGEKTEALAPHLSMCHSAVTARHTVDASAAWNLRLVLDYGRGSRLQVALASAAAAVTKNSSVGGGSSYGGVERIGMAGVGRRTPKDTEKTNGSNGGSDTARARRNDGSGKHSTVEGGGTVGPESEDEAEPPLPFALLHGGLLASLEVELNMFFSSLGFDDAHQGIISTEGATEGQERAVGADGDTRKKSRLWWYLSGGAMDFGGDDRRREDPRLFGAFLAYFGIPARSALEQALGGKVVPAEGLGLADVPALVRCLPGLPPSALLRMIS